MATKGRIKCIAALIVTMSGVVSAHEESSFDDLVKRMDYADTLDKRLKTLYGHASISLFGDELEHILILSPHCARINKNYSLTGACRVGIITATCRWFDGQIILKIPGRD